MRQIELVQVPHDVKIGDVCGHIEPNITEDTIFMSNGEPVGFYLKSISGKLLQYIEIANAELISPRVPKSVMNRTSGEQGLTEKVKQFSTIIGSVPARPHMRRPYPSLSSVHQEKSAQTFIKAMLLACKDASMSLSPKRAMLKAVTLLCLTMPLLWTVATIQCLFILLGAMFTVLRLSCRCVREAIAIVLFSIRSKPSTTIGKHDSL